MGINTSAQVAQSAPPNMDLKEVGKEIFGLAGYKDGSRFLKDEADPRLMQAQQMIQQLQQALQQMQMQLKDKSEENQAKSVVEMHKIQSGQQTEADKRQVDYAALALEKRGQDISHIEALLNAKRAAS